MGKKTTIGAKIRECRIEKGLTQKALAEKLNMSPQQLGLYEKDAHLPRAETIQRIADALEQPVSVLMSPDPDPVQKDYAAMDFYQIGVERIRNKLPDGYQVIPSRDYNHVSLIFPYPDKTILNIPFQDLNAVVNKVMDYLVFELNRMKGRAEYEKQ